MRAICLAIIGAVLAASPATAQGWREYSYSDAGFGIQFPAAPAVIPGEYKTASGLTVPAITYSAQKDNTTYSVMVADLTKAAADQAGAIDHAVKSFAATGEIKVDVEARINREYGHELSVLGKDGSRSIVAIFFIGHRLYELNGKTTPPNAEAGSGSSIRFQQSLQFY